MNPTATVRLACRKCERKGRYRKADLIVKYGASQNLTDMLQLIAQCEKDGKYADWCGAYYVDLAQCAS